LDLDPVLAGERAVVGARDLPVRELVQPQREPLGETAVVDEHDRRAVLLDQPEELRVDRRPDRCRIALAAGSRSGAGKAGTSAPGRLRQAYAATEQWVGCRARARLAHVLDRDDDSNVELLAATRIGEADRASSPPGAGGARCFRAGVAGLAGDASTPDEATDLLERPLRRGKTDPLGRSAEQ